LKFLSFFQGHLLSCHERLPPFAIPFRGLPRSLYANQSPKSTPGVLMYHPADDVPPEILEQAFDIAEAR
jgi:hypothetical protein